VKGTCIDTTEKTVMVDIPSEINIPNVFTPNGDNSNDEFFIKATNMESISLTIIDRWGHLVYQVTSAKGNVLWDGKTAAGKDAAEGVYYYVLKAKGLDRTEFEEKGTISLFR
jgi:gliding motility-associated-like protein